MEEWNRKLLIEKAKELTLRQGKSLTRNEFVRLAGISRNIIDKHFPDGGWGELVRLAKLSFNKHAHGRFTDEDIIATFHSVVKKIEKIPNRHQYDAYKQEEISSSSLIKRFGGMKGILKPYKEWLIIHEPDSPYIKLLDKESTGVAPTAKRVQSTKDNSQSLTEWTKRDGVLYGAPLNFRGLQHAPVNEQGVVYLFGMIASDLGFIVEAIQNAFPDCEAKRLVDARRNRWQRVKIEFQFMSSDFKRDGHPVEGCDLIVCWEHDWADCPLEVIVLRTEIHKLTA